jgi:hypothetical protein
MTPERELELVAKLVSTWHLSVAERRELPHCEAKGSLVVAAIEEVVRTTGKYPASWNPSDPFEGGLITANYSGRCKVLWKFEVGVGRFEAREVECCASVAEAVPGYARRFFGAAIDGIPINWGE